MDRSRAMLLVAALCVALPWALAASSAVPCNSSAVSSATVAAQCAALVGLQVPASAIGLATRGATVTKATLVTASCARTVGVEYCYVEGHIAPVTDSDTTPAGVTIATPVIRFNVFLPTAWNGRALQLGGGGFDGSLSTEEDPSLTRGFATISSDGGHSQNSELLNNEALRNFGREQIKKAHDVGFIVIRTRYGVLPQFSYFTGFSQGGHEALIAANFYPDDYDGVVVGGPAYNYLNLQLDALACVQALYNAHTAADGYAVPCAAGGGWISSAQMTALQSAVVAQCDALDGASDNIVSNPGHPACRQLTARLTRRDPTNPLRCATGAPVASSTCFSDAQLETLARMTSRFAHPPGVVFAEGAVSFPQWAFLDGSADFSLGTSARQHSAVQWLFASTECQIISQNLSVDPLTFDEAHWAARIATMSEWVETSSVNFTRFRAKGGKMLHYHGTTDFLISPYNSIDFFLRMVGQFVNNTAYLGSARAAALNAHVAQNAAATFADGVVDDFYSFYLIPGYGHNSPGPITPVLDWLGALTQWVEAGIAPRSSLSFDMMNAKRVYVGSRPLCTFPYYPLFVGAPGADPNEAANYRCDVLPEYACVLDHTCVDPAL